MTDTRSGAPTRDRTTYSLVFTPYRRGCLEKNTKTDLINGMDHKQQLENHGRTTKKYAL